MKLKIAELRRERGISQTELARRVGATLSMVGKLERGEREMTTRWFQKFAQALDVATVDLVDAAEEPIYAGKVGLGGKIIPALFAEEYNGNVLLENKVSELAERQLAANAPRLLHVEGGPVIRLGPGATIIYKAPIRKPSIAITGRLLIAWVLDLPDTEAQMFVAYVGVLLKGSVAGKFHLLPLGGEVREDVTVGHVCLVDAIQP